MPKILSMRRDFENVRALLASIAETPEIAGFVGVIVLEDGAMVPVSHGVDRGLYAFAANILDAEAMQVEIDDE